MINRIPQLPNNHLLSILLILAMFVAQFPSMRAASAVHVNNQVVVVKPVSNCSQSKTAHAFTNRICQFYSSSVAILTSATEWIYKQTGKLAFLFIAALTTMGFQRRLFKPPR